MDYTRQQIKDMIVAEARRQGVDPSVALGIARTESAYEWWQVGDKGKAVGVFQLHPAAAKDVGLSPEERYDVPKNIRGGIAYYKNRLAREGGHEDRAIAAYNQGIGWRDGQLSNPRYVSLVRKFQGEDQMPRTRTVSASAPGVDPATLRASLPARPTLLQRLASVFSPASAEAAPVEGSRQPGTLASSYRPEGGRSLSQELFDTPPLEAPASPTPPGATSRPEAAGRSLSDDLFGPSPPTVPQVPQAHPAVGRSVEMLRGMGVIPSVQMEQGRHPTLPEIARQRGQEAVQTGLGANLGELAGQAIGSAIAPGPGTVAGGTIGAMAGQAVEDLVRGRPFDPVAVGREGLLSAAPEALEGVLRPVGRWALRSTPGGSALRFDEAARRARQVPEYAFQNQTRQEVGAAFEAVRQSGVRLDIDTITREIRRQTPGKYEELLSEVRRLDDHYKTGGRYTRLVEELRTPPAGRRTVAWDIGDLQQLRSGLRERVDDLETAEARQLLRDFQGAVDGAIDRGLARGWVAAGNTPAQLQEARRQWGRLRGSEDLQHLIEDRVRSSPNLEMLSLRLNTVYDEIRRNHTPAARSINRSLDQTPGGRQRYLRAMHDIGQLFDTIEMPLTDVSGMRRHWAVATIGQMLSTIMTTTAGREAFREAVIDGRGVLSLNAVALAANMGRRELGLTPFTPPDDAAGAGTGP